jgi:hypothetical protein
MLTAAVTAAILFSLKQKRDRESDRASRHLKGVGESLKGSGAKRVRDYKKVDEVFRAEKEM